MSNSFDPDQARRFVGPDLGPNCLPRLSADDTGRQRVKDILKTHDAITYKLNGFLRITFAISQNLICRTQVAPGVDRILTVHKNSTK